MNTPTRAGTIAITKTCRILSRLKPHRARLAVEGEERDVDDDRQADECDHGCHRGEYQAQR